MSDKIDIIDEAIKRTFSRSSIDGPFHEAEKDIIELDNKIEVILNRISLSSEDMRWEELEEIMRRLTTSMSKFRDKVFELRKYKTMFED